MDSVIIAMILVAVLAGGIVTFAHRGRTRMWGLIAILLSIGVSIILYNFICLFPNWKNALLTTSACIIILVILYLLLAIGDTRRNRPLNAALTQNMDQEAFIPPSRTPVPISDCKPSALPNPAKTLKRKKAASRVVLKQVPAAYAKKAQRSAAVDTPIAMSDKISHEPPTEAVFPEPALPAENTDVAAPNVQEWPNGEIAEQICSSITEDNAIKTDASEQLENMPADSVYIALSAEPRLEYEILGQSDEAPTESENIASSAQTRLVEYEPLDRSDEAPTESTILKSEESADLGAENNPEQPTKQFASEPSHTPFKDNIEEIIQLVSAKRYVDAQAGIFKTLSSGYTMTANDKQQLLLIMKLLREKGKRADGATHTR